MRKTTTVERNAREARKASCIFASFAAFAFLVVPSPADAQEFARFSLESVLAVDDFAGTNVSHRPQIIVDVSLAVRMGDNWQVYVRPWFRLPRPNSSTAAIPEWDQQLWQAGLRYERRGNVATRVDVGYMVSPIGLGLFDVRPGLNPTILPHLSYVVSMPAFDATGPRVLPVSASYPLGASITVSTLRWDARAAVINSAPTRVYALGAATNPLQTPVVVAGAGVTPVVGLRVGASVAHGVYATSGEIRSLSPRDRSMTMAGAEGEWAFSGTKISGEILRTAFERLGGTSIAYEGFVQGMQTLSARWFVAARREGASAPPLVNGPVVGTRTSFGMFEATAGFRITPDVTLRGSYVKRHSYGTAWTDQAGASIVWAQRWW